MTRAVRSIRCWPCSVQCFSSLPKYCCERIFSLFTGDDFHFNLKLIAERDSELGHLEGVLSKYKSSMQSRERQIDRLKKRIKEAAAEQKTENSRHAELELYQQEKLSDMGSFTHLMIKFIRVNPTMTFFVQCSWPDLICSRIVY